MAKLKLTPEQRGEALFLLDKGFSVNQAAKTLQEICHPEHPLEVVRKAYFPAHGAFFIDNLRGKKGAAIARKYFQLVESSLGYSKRMHALRKRPDVAVALAEAARKRMQAYNRSPEQTERSRQKMQKFWENQAWVASHRKRKSKTMLGLREDPEFLKKRQAGLERFRAEKRKIAEKAAKPEVKEEVQPIQKLTREERLEMIRTAHQRAVEKRGKK